MTTVTIDVEVEKYVTIDTSVEVDAELVIDQLERKGYAVYRSDDDPLGEYGKIAAAYEAFTSGRLDALERTLRDLFEVSLGRLVGDPPWMRRAA